MKIYVLIKQVPETGSVKMDVKTGTMVREGVESIVNPLDLYAIETALRIKENRGGSVTVISMGPPSASRSLREALAMGCDSAVLVTGREFAGSDTWATARILSAACAKAGDFDMIIAGERATDGDTAQVAPEVAAFLNIPAATYVSSIKEISGGRVTAERLIEGGYETISIETPCLLSVLKEIAVPRLPRLSGKQRSRSAEVKEWGIKDIPELSADEVGLAGSPTHVVKVETPKVARSGRCVRITSPDDIVPAACELIAFLKKKNLLPEEVRHDG